MPCATPGLAAIVLLEVANVFQNHVFRGMFSQDCNNVVDIGATFIMMAILVTRLGERLAGETGT
jgi:hypothetical protein